MEKYMTISFDENKGNKGEWSELYVFLKILAERKLFAADKNLNEIDDVFYQVLKVLRQEKNKFNTYELSDEYLIHVSCEDNSNIEKFSVHNAVIKSCIKDIFLKIKETSGIFAIQELNTIMSQLKCSSIKTKNSHKADIKLIIHDFHIQREHEIGFSIKSEVGGKPTLLNASKATNFEYEIKNLFTNVESINKIKGIKDRITKIESGGATLNFIKNSNNTFKKNLCKIDTFMPLILSELLVRYFKGEASKLNDLCNIVVTSKNFKHLFSEFGVDFDIEDIVFKIKSLLVSIALGMVPATHWNGLLKADGGYIIVKDDGDIVCYHLYNREHFAEYLFKNTKFDTPSSSRHDFGFVYDNQGKKFIKLNMQIRFI